MPVNCAPGYEKVAIQPVYIIERQEYADFFAGGEINAPLVVIFQRDFGFPKAYDFSDITCKIDLGDYQSISVADLFIALFPLTALVAYLVGAKEIIRQKMENNAERMAQNKACGCKLIPPPPDPIIYPEPPEPPPAPVPFPPNPPECDFNDPNRKLIQAIFYNPLPPFNEFRVSSAIAWIVRVEQATGPACGGTTLTGSGAWYNNGAGWILSPTLNSPPGFNALSAEVLGQNCSINLITWSLVRFEYDGQPVGNPGVNEQIWLEAPCPDEPIPPPTDTPDPIEPIDPDTFDFCLEFPELCNTCPPGTGNGRVVTLSADFFETCTTTGNQQYTIEIVGE